jgi:hypothetical protein
VGLIQWCFVGKFNRDWLLGHTLRIESSLTIPRRLLIQFDRKQGEQPQAQHEVWRSSQTIVHKVDTLLRGQLSHLPTVDLSLDPFGFDKHLTQVIPNVLEDVEEEASLQANSN